MTPVNRRRFLGYGIGGVGAALALPWAGAAPAATAAVGGKLAKYVEPLPVPGAGLVVATPRGPGSYAFTQRQISRRLHPQLPPTPVWAYDDGSGLGGQAGSFGMVVVARTGTPLRIGFTNDLPGEYPGWLPVDPRLVPRGREVRVLTHLHGGFVAAASDGNPAITPDGFGSGETQTVRYPNSAPQNPAALLWFHDHGLGATRLNVFAGLAAAYVMRDEYDTGTEPNPIGIPGGRYEIPLVIQDRMFNADGTMLYPSSAIPGVTWVGEYFGDVMLVNGKVWPFLDVEPRLYRLRILNGCNSRILNLNLGGVPMWQIGAEGGLWDRPVPMRQLVLAPAERADVLADFGRVAGQVVVLKNAQPLRPVVTPAPPLSAVMQIRVGAAASQPGPAVPASLPGRAAVLPAPARTRFVPLNEVAPETAAWTVNLGGLPFDAPATELPTAGTVEDWVYVNTTADTHPIHTHLVTFQVISRTPFDAAAYQARYGSSGAGVPAGIDPAPFATGPAEPPMPDERGFKDTVKANPGYFTRIRALFELPAGVSAPQTYVHHCHILEHEDNDMMRPFTVQPPS